MTSNAETWKLREKQLTVPGERKLDMSEKSDVVELLNWHIPEWDTKLHTIPHLTRIRRKDLFSNQDVIYDSEVKDVYQCLCEVPDLTGIAVHSYDQNNAKKTFADVKAKFEIDWILVNSSGVFIIEVGYAKEASNSKNIINKKVEQITGRSKYIVKNIFSASKFHSDPDPLSDSEIKLIVSLPNTPLSQIRNWMEEENNRCIADEHSLIFFTQETSTFQKVFRGSRLQECLLSSLLCGEQPEQKQLQLKFLSGLFVIGKFGLLKADATEYTNKQRKYKKRKSVMNDLDRFLDHIELPGNLILTSEQYDCLDEIIFGNEKIFSVIGEAGTGKSTILLLLLIYYTGEHQEKEKRKRCLFFVPESKWGFREVIEEIVDTLCDKTFAKVCLLGDITNPVIPEELTNDCVILVDELYTVYHIPAKYKSQDVSRLFLRIFNFSTYVHKCVYTFVSSGQLEDYPYKQSGMNQLFQSSFIMRKWLRNSSHIAKLAVKVKRRVHLIRRNFIGLFDSGQPNTSTFATSSTNYSLIESLDSCKNLKQDMIISYCKNYTSHKELSLNFSRAFRIHVSNRCMQHWDFTGLEGLSVAVILDLPELPGGDALEDLLLFLYSAITRARTDLTVFCSSSLFPYVKDLLQLDETDRALNKLQSGEVLSWDELFNCWPIDDRQIAFLLLAVQNSDFKLFQDITSIVLQSSSILIETLGFKKSAIGTELEKKVVLALFLFFALMNPSKTDKNLDYINKLVSQLPENPLQYVIISEEISEMLQCENDWNRDVSLLKMYQHLIPFDKNSRRNNPVLTAFWFPEDQIISEWYRQRWNFYLIKAVARVALVSNRVHLVRAVIFQLSLFVARDDAQTSEFKRNGDLFDVCKDLFMCILYCKNWAKLTDLITSIPDCLKMHEQREYSLLHIAAMHFDEIMAFKTVLEHNKECLFTKDKNDNLTVVEVAYRHRRTRVINYLFDSYHDVYAQREEPKVHPFSVIFCFQGDLNRLQKLIAKQPDLLSPIHTKKCMTIAIKLGHADIVNFLLSTEAFKKVHKPEELFFDACVSGCFEICSMLEASITVKYDKLMAWNGTMQAILLISAGENSVESAKYLLKQNSIFLLTPFHSAIFLAALISRNHALINFLSAFFDKNRIPLTDCAKASIAASRQIQGKLVSLPNYNFFNLDSTLICVLSSWLFKANRDTIYRSISWFEKYRGKINDNVRKKFLRVACEHGHLPLVKYFSVYHPHLLTASICNDESSLLRIAHSHGHKEVTKYLMENHPALLVQAYSMEISLLLLLC